MLEYIARASFKIRDRVVKPGEALHLSALHAAVIASKGYLLETNVLAIQDILVAHDARVRILVDKLHYSPEQASMKATKTIISLLIRNESLKNCSSPSTKFLEDVAEFNRTATGKNPVTKIVSDTGAGEWAGYNCNIGEGCSHGCLYCYASEIAVTRFKRVASKEAWRDEMLIDAKTGKCKKYPEPIMFPTTHDITQAYLPAYRCHLFNILDAGNTVIIVSKPHRECIEAICAEFSSFRDSIIFRFSIGSLDNATQKMWEPGAPSVSERMWCLKHAFEQGCRTSISAEPMLTDRHGAEHLYYAVEPFVTEDIWFGKMNNAGGFRKSENTEIARSASELVAAYKDSEIMALVEHMGALPKVSWKDSIKEVINKYGSRNEDTI